MVNKRRTKDRSPAQQPRKSASHAVSDTAIRTLAQKAGVKRVGKGVFDEFRKMLGG